MDLEKKNKIRQCLTCTLCKKLFYYPVTLYCQDSFCKSCLKNYTMKTNKKDCPSCHNETFIPPIHNFKICDIINKIFPDEIKDREIEINKTQSKLTEEEQIKEEIIKNNWREIVNKYKNDSNNNNGFNNIQPYYA